MHYTYSPHLSTTGQVVRKGTREDQANDDRCQGIHSLHAEGLCEDVEEGVSSRVVDRALNIDYNEQVADQEDDRKDATEEV